MKLLIVNIGFIGDGILAGSLAENCKKNGYEIVDIIVGFPQLFQLLKNNPYIDNVYLSNELTSHPNIPDTIDKSLYDTIYYSDHLVFNEKPLDTFNKKFNLKNLDYDFTIYTPEIEIETKIKPRLAFHYDWSMRSFTKNNIPRDPQYIIDSISDKYEVLVIGDSSHYNVDENTPIDFIKCCALIKECDLFFGYPGGLHWVAGGVRTPSITTSEWVINHYKNNGEFKGNNFEDFKDKWMVHTSKHFNESHILLEPEISNDNIISYLLNHKI